MKRTIWYLLILQLVDSTSPSGTEFISMLRMPCFCQQCQSTQQCHNGSAIPGASWRRLLSTHCLQCEMTVSEVGAGSMYKERWWSFLNIHFFLQVKTPFSSGPALTVWDISPVPLSKRGHGRHSLCTSLSLFSLVFHSAIDVLNVSFCHIQWLFWFLFLF